MKRCIVYHAVCQKRYIAFAKASAQSAKKLMPDVDTVLLTDLPFKSHRFDKIIQVESVKLIDAHLPPLSRLPQYDSGIYLDSDTYVCAPLYDVFELVETTKIDVALVHTSGKGRDYTYPKCGIPEAYPHWRSAFVAFQDHDQTRAFFDLWAKLFREHREKYRDRMAHEGRCYPDQMVMRVALYHSDLVTVTLPPRYCTTLGGIVIRGTISVIAVEGNVEKLAREANREAPHARLFQRGKGTRI